jgi:hypothetical protein
MQKHNKTSRTSLRPIAGHKITELGADELRRTVGALPKTITSGQSTLNCDDWCDCD